MKPIHYIYVLMTQLCLAILISCIREDQADCPANLKVYFAFEPATYARTGVNPEEVDKLNLFIFDSRGIFRGVWVDESPTLTPGYYMTIPVLPEDDYRFIVWGGLKESYITQPASLTAGQTTFVEIQLLLHQLSGAINTRIHPLFHAEKTAHIRSGIREQHIALLLVQAYNTINLTTEGFPFTDDRFRLTITDNNGIYNFDYSFASCGEITYTVPCTPDNDGQMRASLNILKLAADRHPLFEIQNETQQKTLYSADLIALLNQIGDMDYNRIHTFDIHIKFTFDGTDLSATVHINGWEVTEVDEVLY